MAHIKSSPLSSAPSSHLPTPMTSSQQMKRWKKSKELPFELAQHVQIYFEESMFIQAYHLLLSIASSDASSHKDSITVPPPHYLALTSTLAVHPSVTTRTFSRERHEQANSAMRLLRLLQKTTGPIYSRFREAFTFTKYEDRPIGDDVDEGNDSEADYHRHQLNHSFAQEDSIWNRADDFWAVVGWAMNCSCLSGMYASRWQFWQMWLDFMVGVLETDWQYHLAVNDTGTSPRDSILWQYIRLAPGGTVQARRFIRAIFADGSTVSLNEFCEVFKKELREPRQEKKDKDQKREVVDIDNEIYADYLAPDESEASSENETRAQKRTRTTLRRIQSGRRVTARASNSSLHAEFEGDSNDDNEAESRSTPSLGPPESITLRKQLMQLLVQAASFQTLTGTRPTILPSLTDLYTLFVEFIKPLPLNIFEQFITPPLPFHFPLDHDRGVGLDTNTPSPRLNVHTYLILLTFLLQRLLETPTNPIVPDPDVDPTSSSSLSIARIISQSNLETNYLPHAANKSTTDANARVSLCLEGLLRTLSSRDAAHWSVELDAVVEKGVQRRFERAKVRKGDDEDEDEGWTCLVASSRRLKAVVARLKRKKEKEGEFQNRS